jgi:hypothetical protein
VLDWCPSSVFSDGQSCLSNVHCRLGCQTVAPELRFSDGQSCVRQYIVVWWSCSRLPNSCSWTSVLRWTVLRPLVHYLSSGGAASGCQTVAPGLPFGQISSLRVASFCGHLVRTWPTVLVSLICSSHLQRSIGSSGPMDCHQPPFG